jgi:hypothetical protein
MRRKNNLQHLRTMPKRLSALLAAITLLFGIVLPVVLPRYASADQLQSRSLTISSSANGSITTNIAGTAAAAGSGGNGQKTAETFKFNIASAGTTNFGSMLIQFCDDPIPQDPCLTGGTVAGSNIPGFDASHVASIVTQTKNGSAFANSFSVDTTTSLTGSPYNCTNAVGPAVGRQNCIAISAGTANSVANADTIIFKFGGTSSDYITNPTVDNRAFFARITTYSDTAFGTQVDYGTVVGSTAQQIDITAKVKEVLNFSVSPIATQAPGSTCTPLTDNPGPTPAPGALNPALGDANGVLSFTLAYDAHSYFRVSTNTNGGVSVYYSGDTLKNGANSIAATGLTAAVSAAGTPQFGLGLDSSDTAGGNGYSLSLLAPITAGTSPNGTDYSSGSGAINGATGPFAKFGFNTGSVTTPEIIAKSTGPVGCETGSVRYIGNISTATPAGIYYTTITYIATGTY